MDALKSLLYCPALRVKAGELAGVRALTPDVASHVMPRFIVPPRGERDPSHPTLFVIDDAPDVSAALARHWRGHGAFLDVSYVIEEFGRNQIGRWLPGVFQRARAAGVNLVPVTPLADLTEQSAPAFRASVASGALKFGLLVPVAEMIGPDFGRAVGSVLQMLGLAPEECAILPDFCDQDLSEPSFVAPVVAGVLEQLQDLGTWQHIIFQGTHFPEANPATQNSHKLWPRNEWIAWREAMRLDASTDRRMLFGDYAADSSRIARQKGRAPAIRHYRYATPSHWIIQRGTQSGSDTQIMRDVCRKIVDSEFFAGASFSLADAYILATANGEAGPGTATTWRQMNTTHHITRVITDLGKVFGIAIEVMPDVRSNQMSLL